MESHNPTEIFVNLFKWFVLIMSVLLTGFLAVTAAFSTYCVTPDKEETPYSVSDNPLINLIALALFILIIVFVTRSKPFSRFARKMETDARSFRISKGILLLAELIIGVIWVLSTQFIPGADQQYILDSVRQAAAGDLSPFMASGYMSNYPQQFGLFWFEYLLYLIFRDHIVLAFQLINVIFVCLFLSELATICDLLGASHMVQLFTVLLGILFLPLTLFASFVYGNIIGLALAALAIRQEIRFFREYRPASLILSLLAITLSVMVKSNYLIFLIAMAVYAIVMALAGKKWRLLAVALLLMICYLLQSKALLAFSQAYSGQALDRNVSSWSYIAMGLHDSDIIGPGWHDGYVPISLAESNYQPDVQTAAAKEDIKSSLGFYLQNKTHFVDFVYRKIASQWNNPTFQAFWNVQFRESGVTLPHWADSLLHGRLYAFAAEYLNLLQFILLCGALCYFLLADKKETTFLLSLLFAVTIIGGFLFHILWEAKSQYILSYFVLFIPYAAMGYRLLLRKLSPRR